MLFGIIGEPAEPDPSVKDSGGANRSASAKLGVLLDRPQVPLFGLTSMKDPVPLEKPPRDATAPFLRGRLRYSIQNKIPGKIQKNDYELCCFWGKKSNLWLSHCLFVKNFLPSFPQETLEERPACVDAMVELLELAGKGFGPRP